MNVFKDDLFGNKYFIAMSLILFVVVGITWFTNYNSIESKCERYVQRIGSMIGARSGNTLRDLQIHSASEALIKDCVARGGP